jgi:hypothetical protein
MGQDGHSARRGWDGSFLRCQKRTTWLNGAVRTSPDQTAPKTTFEAVGQVPVRNHLNKDLGDLTCAPSARITSASAIERLALFDDSGARNWAK